MVAKSYEISFAEEDEYIILPKKSLYTVIYAVEKEYSVQIKIHIDKLLPAGFVEYMVNMINANRGHRMFGYHYLHKENLDSNDILLILRWQLSLKIKEFQLFHKKVWNKIIRMRQKLPVS